MSTNLSSHNPKTNQDGILRNENFDETIQNSVDRRTVLRNSLVALTGLAVSTASKAEATTNTKSLIDLDVGQGCWQTLSSWNEERQPDRSETTTSISSNLPPDFITYGTRVLLKYDSAISEWWYTHTPTSYIGNNPSQAWRMLATSLGREWQRLLDSSAATQHLYDQYMQIYALDDDSLMNDDSKREAARQINLWFALLPPSLQPQKWKQISTNLKEQSTTSVVVTSPDLFENDFTALLPQPYHTEIDKAAQTRIVPSLPNRIQETDDEDMITTLFGPLPVSWAVSTTSTILTRETPVYGAQVYSLLGLAGATGCAMTHATVIPLDVVKTRAQTDNSGLTLYQEAQRLIKTQGVSSLFLGSQATILGYLWYGASVYPAYTFSKRWLKSLVVDWGSSGLIVIPNSDDVIALVAGAIAAVIASLGLTPLEAARIRAVADPDRYATPGVVGNLKVLAQEKALYAGLPSLLTRQVIFGSVKFLAFERFAVALASASPDILGDPDFSWLLSLLAGGMSGAVSAFISQPADSLLTYVASQERQQSSSDTSNNNMLVGLQELWSQGGPGALWRGLGSRSVWAGSIIAGQVRMTMIGSQIWIFRVCENSFSLSQKVRQRQFFLYDIFRTIAGVSAADLTQVWNYQLNL
jgi:solute carrier family 25 phosphate transporter 3